MEIITKQLSKIPKLQYLDLGLFHNKLGNDSKNLEYLGQGLIQI